MKTKILIIGLAVLLSAGCQTPSTQLNKVHLGMTEAEVVKILGQPASMAESKDGSKTLYYTLRENMGSINSPYSVKLVDGKLDSYGRDAGGTQTTQPMPVIVPMVH
jgi:outer membrane protein assembly factor BamE (lipoprotein component of BamABCDE complex)